MTRYIFEVKDDLEEVIFSTEKPSIEMLEEEIGRFERHFKPISNCCNAEIIDGICQDCKEPCEEDYESQR